MINVIAEDDEYQFLKRQRGKMNLCSVTQEHYHQMGLKSSQRLNDY